MLKIRKEADRSKLTYFLDGRIDSLGSETLENTLQEEDLSKVSEITFDCSNLEFISSAGLRLFLLLKRTVSIFTQIRAVNVSPTVAQVFELTGFTDVISIERAPEASNPPVRAVFFGLHGTLLNSQDKVPASTKKALFQLRDRGIHRILCSTLSPEEISRFPVRDLPFDGFFTLGGNLLLDENQEMFYGQEIDPGEVEVLIRILRAHRIPFALMAEKLCYTNHLDDALTAALPKDHIGHEIDEYKGEKIYQCRAFAGPRKSLMLEEVLEECTLSSGHRNEIVISSKHGGMVAGMDQFMERFTIPRKETMALADRENEAELVFHAGIRVAMGSAGSAVRDAADYVTGDADHNGIPDALRHFRIL